MRRRGGEGGLGGGRWGIRTLAFDPSKFLNRPSDLTSELSVTIFVLVFLSIFLPLSSCPEHVSNICMRTEYDLAHFRDS